MKDKLRWFVVAEWSSWQTHPAIECESEEHAVAVLSMAGMPYTFLNGVDPSIPCFRRRAVWDGGTVRVRDDNQRLDRNSDYLKYIGLL